MSTSPTPEDGPPSVPDARLPSAPDTRTSSIPDGRDHPIPDALPPSAPDGRTTPVPDDRTPSAPDGQPNSVPTGQSLAAINTVSPGDAVHIPDNLMMFRSNDGPLPLASVKKKALRLAKSKVKLRKSTPAPISKGNGRKRLTISPAPEDKQLRKKLDFEEFGESSAGEPHCKGALFPDPTPSSLLPEPEMAPVNANPSPAAVAPVTGEAGTVVGMPEEIPTDLLQPHTDEVSSTNSKMELVADFGMFPKTEVETKGTPESDVLTNPFEESHVSPIGASSLAGKGDNLLSIANLEAAEELDVEAAQPLLAGGRSDGGLPMAGVAPLNAWAGPAPFISSAPFIPSAPDTIMGETDPPDVTETSPCTVLMIEAGPVVGTRQTSPPTPAHLSLEEFPPLVKGRTLKLRDSYEAGMTQSNSGPGEKGRKEDGIESGATGNPGGCASFGPVISTMPKAGVASGRVGAGQDGNRGPNSECAEGSAEVADRPKPPDRNGSDAPVPPSGAGSAWGSASAPRNLANVLRGKSDPNGPHVFVPEKISQIGFASTSNGLPSIYFSGAETKKLADTVGHAIVGKFSHSIPTSIQIQKALNNIKFSGAVSWKHINAKHVLLQFEDITDYARMLSGPKGTPVWYIDRHPMRVFKWTPEFDAYCESPIAAIWCNLIGLPIHLYDQSALFAIGKLLGTPILVDRATADRSRLSFAKICVEIDITKPPPEEIIIDIGGREMVQQVRWGKIPAYCHECKHVGHSSEVCYAAGRMARPEKRNYNSAPPKQTQHGGPGGKGKSAQVHQNPILNDKGPQGRNKGKGGVTDGGAASSVAPHTFTPLEMATSAPGWDGPDILGATPVAHHGDPGEEEDNGDFGNGSMVIDRVYRPHEREPNFHATGYSRGGRGAAHRRRGGSRGYGTSGTRGSCPNELFEY